jgi:ABC-type amino acid transport substrate-binding protein
MHSLRSKFVCAAALALTWFSSAHAQSTLDSIRASGTINLGYRESSIPFSYLDANKKPVGYSLDICMSLVEAIKKELKLPNLKINLVPVQSAERIAFVLERKIDLECGNTTATAERRKQAAFTVPVFMAGAGVLARTDAKAKTLNDLRGKRVTVLAGSTGEKVLAEANKQGFGLVAVPVKSSGDAFAAIQEDKAQAWITDDVILASFRANAEKPVDFTLLTRRHTVEPLAIMYRLNDTAFETLVDREMLNMFRERKIEALYKQWFQSPIPPKNVTIGLEPSYLLRELLRSPSKTVPSLDMIWI